MPVGMVKRHVKSAGGLKHALKAAYARAALAATEPI
jgi:hypothetical protein